MAKGYNLLLISHSLAMLLIYHLATATSLLYINIYSMVRTKQLFMIISWEYVIFLF